MVGGLLGWNRKAQVEHRKPRHYPILRTANTPKLEKSRQSVVTMVFTPAEK
jgi:hypothetical protein